MHNFSLEILVCRFLHNFDNKSSAIHKPLFLNWSRLYFNLGFSINNFKDYEDFTEENKQYDSSDSQHDYTQLNDVTSWSESEKRRLISSFHQTDLSEIQVFYKNIRGLNRNTIYRTFKAINKIKGFKEDMDQEENIL